jgi:P4 family phage/plasmid primase-like protien
MDPESDEYKMTMYRADKILNIAMLLGSTKDKDNIMKEARELFYNPDFMEKLDENKYLLCFNNGVIDFKEKIFRKGYPEDYISKCTNIDYVPLNPAIHKTTMEEINDYMHKVFPIDELYNYMWEHLASVLIGDIALNQRLHYYTGIGSNGKSMLVKLMQLCLGNYAVELDVSFYTQERPKRGQSTPELFAIMGARYAVTAEPSEGDKLNEGPMKQLTSGTDKMSCRAPYGQLVSFTPQANPVIMANHFLDIKSTDHGTWRRIAVIEFMSLFTDEPVKGDKSKPYQFKKVESFDAKFEEWVPIFMSMLVQLAFKTGGIAKLCPMVMASSNRYKQNQDFISEFIGEKITKDANGKIKKTELLFEFSEWYKNNYGTRINKTKELYAAMNKLFGECKSTFWAGAKIIYDRDTEYDGTSSILSNGGNTAFTDREDDDTEINL